MKVTWCEKCGFTKERRGGQCSWKAGKQGGKLASKGQVWAGLQWPQ